MNQASTLTLETDANKTFGEQTEDYLIEQRLEEAEITLNRAKDLYPGTKQPAGSWQDELLQSPENAGNDYCLRTGDNLVILDIDNWELVSDKVQQFVSRISTFTVKSPHSEGKEGHYYLKVDKPVSTKHPGGYDLQGENALIVGPGTALTSCDNGCCRTSNPGKYTTTNDIPILETSRQQLESITGLDLDPKPDSVHNESTELENVIGPRELTDNGFHPIEEWENIPSTRHTYFDRKDRFFEKDWNGKERFDLLLEGEHEAAGFSGSDPIGVGESVLASIFGFIFGKNRKVVAYYMEQLPYETKYSKNPYHRKSVLDFAESVDWVYCEGVDLLCKYTVAGDLYEFSDRQRSVKDIQRFAKVPKEDRNYSPKQIQNALKVLECEGVAEKEVVEHGKHLWSNISIDKGYLLGLESSKKSLNDD